MAGVFCPRYRVEDAINKGEYSPILEEVQGITRKADFSLVNYECPVVENGTKPIRKQGIFDQKLRVENQTCCGTPCQTSVLLKERTR